MREGWWAVGMLSVIERWFSGVSVVVMCGVCGVCVCGGGGGGAEGLHGAVIERGEVQRVSGTHPYRQDDKLNRSRQGYNVGLAEVSNSPR
jgi:hypothetical protein